MAKAVNSSSKYQASGKTLKRSVAKPLPKAGSKVVHGAAPYESNHKPHAKLKNSAPSGK